MLGLRPRARSRTVRKMLSTSSCTRRPRGRERIGPRARADSLRVGALETSKLHPQRGEHLAT